MLAVSAWLHCSLNGFSTEKHYGCWQAAPGCIALSMALDQKSIMDAGGQRLAALLYKYILVPLQVPIQVPFGIPKLSPKP